MKKLILLLLASGALLTGCGNDNHASDQQVSQLSSATKANHSIKRDVAKTKAENSQLAESISALKAKLKSAATSTNPSSTAATSASQPAAATTPAQLAAQDFAGQQEIAINHNDPGFSHDELNTASGAWERYADLDNLNRATDAQALLNQSLMPTAKREPLTWDPTGWHNRRTAHGWLYNRSHLIGFQLSGENNNPKNLITGTMSLNNPLMLAHEMDIATYLKADANRYVRYQVRPVYRGDELVARGVQMRAQSIGDNQIHFNVYIFNVEAGYKIDYATGTSTTD